MKRQALAVLSVGYVLVSCSLVTSFDGLTGGVSNADGGIDSQAEASASDVVLSSDSCSGADLTRDPKDCGTCGHDCCGGACLNGQCQPRMLVSGRASPFAMALHDGYIYWSENGGNGKGGVSRVPTAGGLPELVGGTCCSSTVGGLAVTDRFLFYTAYDGVGFKQLDGGPTAFFGRGGSFFTPSMPVVADEVSLVASGQNFSATRWPSTGPFPMPPDAGTVVGAGVAAVRLALQGTGVFASTWGANREQGSVVRALTTDPFATTTLAASQATPMGIAADSTGVYWVDYGTSAKNHADGSVQTYPLVGGAVRTIAAAEPMPTAVAVDDTNVYWTRGGLTDGAVVRAPKGASLATPVVLATNQHQPVDIALDERCVYFLDRGPKDINTGNIDLDAEAADLGAVMVIAK